MKNLRSDNLIFSIFVGEILEFLIAIWSMKWSLIRFEQKFFFAFSFIYLFTRKKLKLQKFEKRERKNRKICFDSIGKFQVAACIPSWALDFLPARTGEKMSVSMPFHINNVHDDVYWKCEILESLFYFILFFFCILFFIKRIHDRFPMMNEIENLGMEQ